MSEAVSIPRRIARWWMTFREDLAAGHVDLEELLEAVASDLEATEDRDLCPDCVTRPIAERGAGLRGAHTAGLCLRCHLERLRQAHIEALQDLEAKRLLNDAQQALCRARQQAGVAAPHAPRAPRKQGGAHG